MDKNNYVESRVKDFLAGLYNLRSDGSKNSYKTQTVSCGIKEAEINDGGIYNDFYDYNRRRDYELIKNMIFGDFDYQEYESKNALLIKSHHKSIDVGGSAGKDPEEAFLLYGNIDNIIKYGDENYKKLVAVFEKTIKNNDKSWVNDVNDFIKLGKGKNGMFSQDLNGQKFYIMDCEIEYNKDNQTIKEVTVENWKEEQEENEKYSDTRPAIDWIKEKNKERIYLTDKFTINWQSELAIADFLLDVIKARYDQGIKITTEEILNLSENIPDKDMQTKFKLCSLNFLFEHVEKPKESNFDGTFGLKDKDVYKLYKASVQEKQNYIKDLFKDSDESTRFLAINWLYSWPDIENSASGGFGTDVTKPICADKERFENLIIYHVGNRTLNENLVRDKLNEEEANLYKNSFIDMKFVFDFLDTGKLDKSKNPWGFDEKCQKFVEFLNKIPIEAKIKFDPDELNQDQKYLLMTSLLDSCFKFIIDYGMEQFVIDALDFEKYKLEDETKKMINIYFEKNIKPRIDEQLEATNKYQSALKKNLDIYLKEYENAEEKNKISNNILSSLEKQKKSIDSLLAEQKTFEDYVKNETAKALESGNTGNFKLENLLFDGENSIITNENSAAKDLFTNMTNDLKTELNRFVDVLSKYSKEIIDLNEQKTNLEKRLKQLKNDSSEEKIKSLESQKSDIEKQIQFQLGYKEAASGFSSIFKKILVFIAGKFHISDLIFKQYTIEIKKLETCKNELANLNSEKDDLEAKINKLKENETKIKTTEDKLKSLYNSIDKIESTREDFINNASTLMMEKFNSHIESFKSKSSELLKKINDTKFDRFKAKENVRYNKNKNEIEEYKYQINYNKTRIDEYNLFLEKVSDGLDIQKNKMEKKHPFGIIENKKAESQKGSKTDNKKDFTK